jgi:hypothetical protein
MSILDLFRPKWKHSDYDVRCKAVEGITDQLKLARIAARDRHWSVRMAAAAKLSDIEGAQAVYLDIAKHEQDGRGRLEAVEHLTDQSALAGIAKKDWDSCVRERAVRRLADQAVLTEIAKTDADHFVRTDAARKLVDQSVLAEIAAKDRHWLVRIVAAAKLSDVEGAQAVYLDIAKNDEDRAGRKAAIERIADQSVLAEIVLDKDVSVAHAAMDRLTDQHILATVAINDIGGVFGRASVLKIKDHSLLVQVARDGVNPEVRLWAGGALTGLDYYKTQNLAWSLNSLKEYLKAGFDETGKASSSLSTTRLIETAFCAFTDKYGYRCATVEAAMAFRDEARSIAMKVCDLVDPALVTEPGVHDKLCKLKLIHIEYRISTRFVIDVPAVTSTWISRGDYGGPAGQVNEEEIVPAQGHDEPDGYIVEVSFSKPSAREIDLARTTSATWLSDDQSNGYAIDEDRESNDPCKDCHPATEFACIGCAGNR